MNSVIFIDFWRLFLSKNDQLSKIKILRQYCHNLAAILQQYEFVTKSSIFLPLVAILWQYHSNIAATARASIY